MTHASTSRLPAAAGTNDDGALMRNRNSGLIAATVLAAALAASVSASAQQAATPPQAPAPAQAPAQAPAAGTASNPAAAALGALTAPPAAAATQGAAPAPGIAGAATSLLGGQPISAAGVMKLEPGLYRCELSRRVVVRRIDSDGQSMVINWQGKDHTLNAVTARTGALRFENAQEGLMWLVIVGKAMLLDMRRGQQLANECTL